MKTGDLVRQCTPIKNCTKYDNPPLVVLHIEKLYPMWTDIHKPDTCVYVLDTSSDVQEYYYDWELEYIN